MNASTDYHWHSALSDAIARNRRDAHHRYLQLATIGTDGYPANRTVVFRGFHDQELLTMVTDRRSTKVAQIQNNPSAEACWYFTRTREQFRIRGQLIMIDGQSPQAGARRDAWLTLSAGAREQFYWRSPGVALDQGNGPVIGDDDMPESFLLLALRPECVDHLLLLGRPQRRWRSERADEQWGAVAINP